MSVGSSYATVKNALATLLAARTGLNGVAVSSQAPLQASDLTGSGGAKDSIWIDDTEGEYSDECFRALPLAFDETYGLKVVIQSLKDSDAGTQYQADLRVDQMLYEVLAQIANDATLGVHSFNYLYVLPSAFRRVTGFLPTGAGHGSRCELTVEVKCRHTF